MDIAELTKKGIEKIKSMSILGLRDKFIEHGYKPNTKLIDIMTEWYHFIFGWVPCLIVLFVQEKILRKPK